MYSALNLTIHPFLSIQHLYFIMDKLNDIRYNSAAILASALFCLLVVANTDYAESDGMAFIALLLIPLITAGFAFFGFFLLKKMVPRLAWLPTLIAVVFLLFIGVSALLQ